MDNKSKYLTVTIKGKDLDCVKNAIKVINNKVYTNGYFSEYDYKLLDTLLGDNWNEEYVIGKVYLD